MKLRVFGVLISVHFKYMSCPEALPRCCTHYMELSQALETRQCGGEQAAMCEKGCSSFEIKEIKDLTEKNQLTVLLSHFCTFNSNHAWKSVQCGRLPALLPGLVLVTLRTGLQSLPPSHMCLERMDKVFTCPWGGKQRTAQSWSEPNRVPLRVKTQDERRRN